MTNDRPDCIVCGAQRDECGCTEPRCKNYRARCKDAPAPDAATWRDHFTTWEAFLGYVRGLRAGEREWWPWFSHQEYRQAVTELDTPAPAADPDPPSRSDVARMRR